MRIVDIEGRMIEIFHAANMVGAAVVNATGSIEFTNPAYFSEYYTVSERLRATDATAYKNALAQIRKMYKGK